MGIDGNYHAISKFKPHDKEDVPVFDGLGYFAESVRYAAFQKEAVTDKNEVSSLPQYVGRRLSFLQHKSTCSTLRSMRLVTNRKGVEVTGIIAVVCVRHSCFCNGSVVDMIVGEKFVPPPHLDLPSLTLPRFALLDYSLAAALEQFGDPDLLMYLMCDKGCQYKVNLKARFKACFPHLYQIIVELKVLINKLHLQGHKEDCRYEMSPQYTHGCGRTDGEGVERPWPNNNETSVITADQNPGNRKDTHDDDKADWNYQKLIKMGEPRLYLCRFCGLTNAQHPHS